MKKVLLLTGSLMFAMHLGAFAEKPYTPPVVPDAGKVLQDVQHEDDNCKDISPIHGQNCNGNGKHHGNGHGDGNGNNGKDNGKGNGGNDNGKGNGK